MINEKKQRLAITIDKKCLEVLSQIQDMHSPRSSKSQIIEVAIIAYGAALVDLYSKSTTKGE